MEKIENCIGMVKKDIIVLFQKIKVEVNVSVVSYTPELQNVPILLPKSLFFDVGHID